MEINKIHCCDWLYNELPAKSVNLLICDPPYFEVKGDFDFVWTNFDSYLETVVAWAHECKRILADNGTLFWYGHAKKIAYAQVIFDKYFTLENNIVIEFGDRQTKRGMDGFRCFAPVTERLLMYSNDQIMTGTQYVEETFVKPANPFRDILRQAREKAGLSTISVAAHGGFFGKVNHGGMVANWENGDAIPNADQWAVLRQILPLGEYEPVKAKYDEVRANFEAERLQHELKRRPFDNFMKLYDVMKFNQESHITKKYNHDTCKPETLTRALILTCSRPGDLVCIPFSGSGTECAMALREKRRFIGFDISDEYVKMGNERCRLVAQSPTLL
jgi:site-specific DNA-methyltransferase (adenine-specific)